jgi:uncharacterized membrane protein YbaN (DUF454 family)
MFPSQLLHTATFILLKPLCNHAPSQRMQYITLQHSRIQAVVALLQHQNSNLQSRKNFKHFIRYVGKNFLKI